MLASHARPHVPRAARATTRSLRARAGREPRRAEGLGRRRILLHLFCLGLAWLAVSGPLTALSSVGSRGEVAVAVERHARFLAALEEADAPGGWTVPRFPLTIAEVAASSPAEPALPAAPASLTQPTAVAAEARPAAVAATPASPAARPAVPVASPAREAARAALAQRFGGLSEAYGVLVLDSDGTPIFQHRPTALFQAASLYKLGVAAEVFRQVRSGVISLKDSMTITKEALIEGDTIFAASDVGNKITIGQAVDVMITRSSNVAAILLLKRIGPYNVNAIFAELGLTETRLLERPFRNTYGNAKNQTTARDIGRFFDLLLHGKVVDKEGSEAIIKLLARQKIDDRLPAALPQGVLVAHKTGNLVGVVHDAGIIYTPAPIIVVALSQDATSEAEAVATITQVARVAYEAYTGATPPPEPPAAR